MTITETDLHAQLREWARGLTPLSAATEMLIRAGWAQPGQPWLREEIDGAAWIDFEALPELIGGMSGGEQRFLRIAASLAADSPIILGDEVTGLDHRLAALVIAGIAHAAGFGEPTRAIEVADDGTSSLGWAPALAGWPE